MNNLISYELFAKYGCGGFWKSEYATMDLGQLLGILQKESRMTDLVGKIRHMNHMKRINKSKIKI